MSERERILSILRNNEAARCDDLILYAELLKGLDIPANTKSILIDSFYNHIELQLPNFHTVIRARRELQKNNPELVNKTAVEARRAAERRFRQEYGKRGKIQ